MTTEYFAEMMYLRGQIAAILRQQIELQKELTKLESKLENLDGNNK